MIDARKSATLLTVWSPAVSTARAGGILIKKLLTKAVTPKPSSEKCLNANSRPKCNDRIALTELAKPAVAVGGSLFSKTGRMTLYEQDALDNWTRSRINAPIRSTSETPSR
jgi:hypothetical protein